MRPHAVHIHIGRLVVDPSVAGAGGVHMEALASAVQAEIASQAGWTVPARADGRSARLEPVARIIGGGIVNRLRSRQIAE
jgi:hypothetical protein